MADDFTKVTISTTDITWKKDFMEVPAGATVSVSVNGTIEFESTVPAEKKYTGLRVTLRGTEEDA